jgi:hypothetical protein
MEIDMPQTDGGESELVGMKREDMALIEVQVVKPFNFGDDDCVLRRYHFETECPLMTRSTIEIRPPPGYLASQCGHMVPSRPITIKPFAAFCITRKLVVPWGQDRPPEPAQFKFLSFFPTKQRKS